jgi:flagellar basal body P-ring formation protein FlgA
MESMFARWLKQFGWTATLLVLLPGGVSAGESLVIRLRPAVTVTSRVVRVDDIAAISGPAAAAARELDIAEIPEDQTQIAVPRSLIHVRLQLAGLDSQDDRWLGPELTLVSLEAGDRPPRSSLVRQVSATSTEDGVAGALPEDRLTDRAVETAVQTALAGQFAVPLDEVSVHLLHPVTESARTTGVQIRDPHLEVITPPEFPLGRTTLTLRIWEGDRMADSRPIQVEVRRKQKLLIARRTIGRGGAVTSTAVASEVRYVDRLQDELTYRDIGGLTARRMIRAGEVIRTDDLENRDAQESPAEVIRSRDAVRIIAQRKGLQVALHVGEALQSGRVGQIIRVRNPQSDRVIAGRVIGVGQVEVDLE